MAENNSELAAQPLPTRVLKLLISLVAFAITEVWVALGQLIGKSRAADCIIVYYHCILPQHRLRFAKQMDMLLRNAMPISVGDSEPLMAGRRYAGVTFDDGFVGVAQNAAPELVKRHIPATVFVTSDLLGQNPAWPGYPDRFMSLEELLALPNDLIVLGCHTRHHPRLPLLSEDEAWDEIAVSREKLSKMLGRDCNLFAFPYGAFNQRIIEICREAGYRRVFTTLPHPAQLGPSEFVSGRVTVEPTDWPIEFFLKLRGSYAWLPVAFAAKRNLRALFKRPGANHPMTSDQLRSA